MSFPYKKVLLIGASSGIGEALATRMVAEGLHVIVVGRRKVRLDAFVSKHGSDKATAAAFDISELDKIPEFAKSITTAHPDLDCLVLNGGIQRAFNFAQAETVNLELVQYELTVNYMSYVAFTKAFLTFFESKSTPAAVVYTTSGLALTPIPRYPTYSACKGALHNFILSIREQMRPTEIKVIELIPPLVETELNDEKNQPELAGKAPKGIPLDQFTNEAWEGLAAGKDQIPVGTAKIGYAEGGFEVLRQQAMFKLIELVKRIMGS